MKNLENYGVVPLDNKEIKKTDGGWADSTNDGMYGQGDPWTGGGSGGGSDIDSTDNWWFLLYLWERSQ